MCSLCGVLGGNDHWTDAIARPGVFSRNTSPVERHRERLRRVAAANRLLAAYGLSLGHWQGNCYLLSNRTGKTEVIEDLGHLWPAAERLAGRPCDPLDPHLLDRLAGAAHG